MQEGGGEKERLITHKSKRNVSFEEKGEKLSSRGEEKSANLKGAADENGRRTSSPSPQKKKKEHLHRSPGKKNPAVGIQDSRGGEKDGRKRD